MTIWSRFFEGQDNMQFNINLLKDKVHSIKETYGNLSKILKQDGKIDLAFIWLEQVQGYFRFIAEEAKIILGLYKSDKRRYKKQYKNTKNLIKHIQKPKAKDRWILKLEEYLDKMESDLEMIIRDAEKPKESYGLNRRQFLARMPISALALRSAYGIILSAAALKVLEQYLIHEASKLPLNNDNGLAILVSKPEEVDSILGSYFKGIYAARVQLALGIKAKRVIIDATSKDLKQSLYDSTIQNLSILGHGSRGGWDAPEDNPNEPTHKDFSLLKEWFSEHPIQKNGYLLKHTCGDKTEESETYLTPKAFRELETFRLRFQDYANLRLRQFPQEEKDRYVKWYNKLATQNANDVYYRRRWLNRALETKNMSIEEYTQKELANMPVKVFVIWSKKFGSDGVGYEVDSLVLSKDGQNKPEITPFYPIDIHKKLEQLNEQIKEFKANPENIVRYPKLFGVPFFKPERIMAWQRVTYIQDFLFNPFANTQITFDRYSSRMMQLAEYVRNKI